MHLDKCTSSENPVTVQHQPPPPADLTMSGYSNRPNFIGSVQDEWELYSDRFEDYTVGAPIGFGASSTVYAAKFHPPMKNGSGQLESTPCALKVLDLDRLPPHSLSLLQRETTLMSLSKHPNVLRVRGSWMDGHKLYIALRLMNKGSAADVMRYGWPGGMEEDVVRCILRQALLGLNYLHINGFIHRDIKAANLLIDDDGTVLLGDLGVAANLAEPSDSHAASSSKSYHHSRPAAAILSQPQTTTGSHSSVGSGRRVAIANPGHPGLKPKIGKRKSFVGTPCWMAPELIQGRQYDSSADIWSFGITALELSQGRAPRSRESPQKVLLRTIQDDPPTVDRVNGTYKYSKAFKDMVDSCLVKDPSKRPTAEQLLQTPFFKASKKKSYLVGAILKDLPPLSHRQERRRAASVQLHGTVDSWDFGSLLPGSPTTSVYRRHALEAAELEGITSVGLSPVIPSSRTSLHVEPAVFEAEGESDGSVEEKSMLGEAIPIRRQSRVSWAERPIEDSPESSSPESDEPGMGGDDTASSSPHSSVAGSPSPVPPLDAPGSKGWGSNVNTPTSELQGFDLTPQAVTPAGANTSEFPSRPPVPRTSTAYIARIGHEKQPSIGLSQPPAPKRTQDAPNGFWRKIAKRTTSISKLDEKAHDKDADKKGYRMGSILARKASAGKDALARSTSRTAHAVGFTPAK